MKIAPIYVILLIVIVLMILGSATVVQAQVGPGLDVVFIVDRSDSMNGSDPDNNAAEGVREALEILLSRATSNQLVAGVDNVESIRFAVIAFAEDGITRIPLTSLEVACDVETSRCQSNALSQFNDLKITRDGSNTFFSQAFAEACRLLEEQATADCSGVFPDERQRALVLLTDGAPTELDTYQRTPENDYFDQLRSNFSALLDSSRLWVIGLDKNAQACAAPGQSSTSNSFWDSYRSGWKKVAGADDIRLACGDQNIVPVFQDIADLLVARAPLQAVPCDGTTVVPIDPLRSTTLFIVTYARPLVGSPTGIYPPGSTQPLPKNSANTSGDNRVVRYSTTRFSEFYQIERPTAGGWTCQYNGPKDSQSPQIRAIQGDYLFSKVRVAQEPLKGEGVVSLCKSFHLNIQFQDNDGRPLRVSDDTFAASVYVHPVATGGEPQIVPLKVSDSSTETWRTAEPITPAGEAEFRTEVEVSQVRTGSVIFRSPAQRIMVDARYPCELLILEPAADAQIALGIRQALGWQPSTEIAVELRRADGGPIDPALFQQQLSEVIQIYVTGPGATELPQISLEPTDKPGHFKAAIFGLSEGTYQLSADFRATTQETVAYQLVTASPTTIVVAPDLLLRALKIVRIALIVLAISVVLGGLIRMAFLVIGPYPRGYLTLEAQGVDQTVVQGPINLGTQRRLGLFQTRIVKITPKKDLSQMGETNVLKVYVAGGGKRAGVYVKIKRAKGNHDTVTLYDGDTAKNVGKLRIIYRLKMP